MYLSWLRDCRCQPRDDNEGALQLTEHLKVEGGGGGCGERLWRVAPELPHDSLQDAATAYYFIYHLFHSTVLLLSPCACTWHVPDENSLLVRNFSLPPVDKMLLISKFVRDWGGGVCRKKMNTVGYTYTSGLSTVDQISILDTKDT